MRPSRRHCLAFGLVAGALPGALFAQQPRRALLWMNAFIPRDIPGLTRPAGGSFAGKTMIRGPVPGVSDCYLTDNRSFSTDPTASSRLHSLCEIDLTQRKIIRQTHRCDPTIEIDCDNFEVECQHSASTSNMGFSNVVDKGGKLTIDYRGAANNGCVSIAPDIDIVAAFIIDLAARSVSFDGRCEPFPAFELYVAIDGVSTAPLVLRQPDSGSSPWNLPGSPNKNISGRVSF